MKNTADPAILQTQDAVGLLGSTNKVDVFVGTSIPFQVMQGL